MTTYKREVNIYNTEAIQDGIDGAAATASDYITEISNDGIMVHAEGEGPDDTQNPSGWHISDVLEYIREGVSRFWIGLKNQNDSSPTVRIGKEYASGATDNESHMELDYHSLKLISLENDIYLHVSDLRESDGIANLEYEIPDVYGNRFIVNLPYQVTNLKVYVDNVETSSFTTETVMNTFLEITFTKVSITGMGSGRHIIRLTFSTTYNTYAFTFGNRVGNLGAKSASFGHMNTASGFASFVNGGVNNASGIDSHAEGEETESRGTGSHSEGKQTLAMGDYSHAEGYGCESMGNYSHAEGYGCESNGIGSFAGGLNSTAEHNYSFCFGNAVESTASYQMVIGKSNDGEPKDVPFIIGRGNNTDSLNIDWNGLITEYEYRYNQQTTDVSSEIWHSPVKVLDAYGFTLGLLGLVKRTNGRQDMGLYAYADNALGDGGANGFIVGKYPNGTNYYFVSDQAAFRNAIGASSGKFPQSVGGTGASSLYKTLSNTGAWDTGNSNLAAGASTTATVTFSVPSGYSIAAVRRVSTGRAMASLSGFYISGNKVIVNINNSSNSALASTSATVDVLCLPTA